MTRASSLLVAAVLGLAACKPASDAPKVDTAAEEVAIRAKEAGWMEAYNKHDATTLAAQFAEDGASANPGAALLSTAADRKKFLEGVTADPALKVDFSSDRIIVAASGDLASSRGHYSFTFTDPATKKPKTESGNYLTVYRKADGKWLAVEDFVTPGAAEAAAP
jgi:uncharacterized protein (TIGR02246 family)